MNIYDILKNNKGILRSSLEMLISKYFSEYYDSYYEAEYYDNKLLITVKTTSEILFFIKIPTANNYDIDVGIYLINSDYDNTINIKSDFRTHIIYEYRKKVIDSI